MAYYFSEDAISFWAQELAGRLANGEDPRAAVAGLYHL